MIYILVKLYILLHLTGSFAWAEEHVYVSLYGKDSITCGKQSLPCRTIIYAISQGSSIYLDGTNTSQYPYTCQLLDPTHPGNHLTIKKSISFAGIKSRAHISCLHDRKWLFDGAKHKDGLQVNFHNVAFQSTTLHFVNTMVNVSDSLFLDSQTVSMTFVIFNLARFDLVLNQVVFKNNTFCILVKSNTNANISITNSLFYQNGNHDSSALQLPSILWVESDKSNIDIKVRNSSFKENTFKKKGMISTKNIQATTNILLHGITFENNGHNRTLSGSFNGILLVESAHVILNLDGGIVHGTFGTFLTFAGHESVQVNVSNTTVEEFYSPDKGGGVFNILPTLSAYMSIKDSLFRNGKTLSHGSVIAMVAPNLKLTIQNSTIKNISNPKSNASIYLVSYNPTWPSGIKNVLKLDITNSTFSDCRSQAGGVYLVAKNLFMSISESWFIGNNGGALHFQTYGVTLINLQNVRFLKNSASIGGIVDGRAINSNSIFKFTCNNTWFIDNNFRAKQPANNSGIFHLVSVSEISSINIRSTHVIRNTGVNSSVFYLELNSTSLAYGFIILDAFSFKENLGAHGSFSVVGQATLICKNSVFESNCGSAGFYFSADMKQSKINIRNTTFLQNYCSVLQMHLHGSTCLEVEDSTFVGNRFLKGSGTISIHVHEIKRQKQYFCRFNSFVVDALLKNVSFQENLGSTGSVLILVNAVAIIQSCVFKNNFANPFGGQIVSAGWSGIVLFNSTFKQTIQRIMINETEFVVATFLQILSDGVLAIVNTTIDLRTKSDKPLIKATRSKQIIFSNYSVATCPVGSRLMYSTFQSSFHKYDLDFSCAPCGHKFYSLQRGYVKGMYAHNFKCLPCPRGADCLPTVKSKPNFWGYHASLNPPTLAFTLCPFGYCKSPPGRSPKYNDCQGKRVGVMCGSCSLGYTEALWSTKCTPIKDCYDYWFWILFLALVLFMAVLLVFKPPLITYLLKHLLWFKSSNTYAANSQRFGSNDANHLILFDEDADNNMPLSSRQQFKNSKRQFSRFLEIIFYFYQMAKLLSFTYPLKEFIDNQILPPVLGFFNFEPRLHKQGFLCPFPGLTPMTKFAFQMLPVFGTMLAIFFIYLLHVIMNKFLTSRRPSISSYLQAGIKTLFLGYTTLATVGISLTRCVPVAGEDRWFYNGNVICYQWWQYLSFAFNGIFVIPFIFVLAWASFKVHHGTITVGQFLLSISLPLPFLMLWSFRVVFRCEAGSVVESENFVAIKEMLLGPYKEPGNGSKHGAMYWQSVLIARRFILVLVFCTVTEPSIRLFCMTLACIFVLFFHLKFKPFRNSLANDLESLSLLLLVILGLINLFKSVFLGIEESIKGPLVTVFKVFQWVEIVILGLFPALLSLLVCLAIISITLRVLFMCCRSFLKCIFRHSSCGRLFHDESDLLNLCDDAND